MEGVLTVVVAVVEAVPFSIAATSTALSGAAGAGLGGAGLGVGAAGVAGAGVAAMVSAGGMGAGAAIGDDAAAAGSGVAVTGAGAATGEGITLATSMTMFGEMGRGFPSRTNGIAMTARSTKTTAPINCWRARRRRLCSSVFCAALVGAGVAPSKSVIKGDGQ